MNFSFYTIYFFNCFYLIFDLDFKLPKSFHIQNICILCNIYLNIDYYHHFTSKTVWERKFLDQTLQKDWIKSLIFNKKNLALLLDADTFLMKLNFIIIFQKLLTSPSSCRNLFISKLPLKTAADEIRREKQSESFWV